MITKIARKLFNVTLADKTGDAEFSVAARKGIAFAILVKSKVPCSVLRDWSIRDLSRLTGCSQATCRKRIKTLRQLHLIREDGRNLVFKHLYKEKVKDKHGHGTFHTPVQSNIYLCGMDYTSCKSIEHSLEALVIVEDSRHKNYYRRLIGLNRNPRPSDSLAAHKRAQRLCRKKGLEGKFVDGGFSYTGIARRIGCSKTKAQAVVDFAMKQKMVNKCKLDPVLFLYSKILPAKQALKYIDEVKPLFATNCNIWYQPSNVYPLGDCISRREYRQLLYHSKKVCIG